MLLRHRVIDDSYYRLVEKIKKDLLSSLQKKGIDIAKIQVDMKSGNMNVEVLIGDRHR